MPAEDFRPGRLIFVSLALVVLGTAAALAAVQLVGHAPLALVVLLALFVLACFALAAYFANNGPAHRRARLRTRHASQRADADTPG
jgi:hypothetical protein